MKWSIFLFHYEQLWLFVVKITVKNYFFRINLESARALRSLITFFIHVMTNDSFKSLGRECARPILQARSSRTQRSTFRLGRAVGGSDTRKIPVSIFFCPAFTIIFPLVLTYTFQKLSCNLQNLHD